MFRLFACAGLLSGMFIFALPSDVRGDGDKLPKVEISKRGKAATAYVELKIKGGTASGTAFCVHPSGLFVTNEHVVHDISGDEVTLVMNPSLNNEKVFKAKVVRTNKVVDLALLRAANAADLPSLTLGTVDGVSELAEVVACGFPLGKALATNKKGYPAVSVNTGSVTSLRKKGDQLEFIQLDVALTFGNSGGPVLDDTGKVVGVVVSGIRGTSINQAIPVNVLSNFLKAPEVSFIPPEVTRANLDKPMEFKAKAVSFMPNTPEPVLKLILKAGDQEPREFPMKKLGDSWVATATPAPVTKTAARVEISVRLGTASISGTADDVEFKVGEKPMRLSGVKRIDFKSKPSVLLADGRTTVEGEITGLGSVEIDLAGQKVKLDLAKATQLIVQSTPEIVSVLATVVATVDGKEVARSESQLLAREVTRLAPADPGSMVIVPPTIESDKVVKKLPDTFADVVVGGAGRYLIFHLAKLKKLAVFDMNEARVTKYIPLAENDITFTAGLDCIVVGLKQANRLERWSLTTFELEKSATPPFKENITGVLMGHASNGPLVANGYLLDLASFQILPVLSDKGKERPLDSALRLFASGDGTVFSAWLSNQSPIEAVTFVYEGGVVKRYLAYELMHVIPGPDGKSVYTAKGVVSANLTRGDAYDSTYGYCLPAVRGDYFLSLTSANAGKGGGMTVYLRGLKQPIAKLDKVEHGVTFAGWDREKSGPWKQVYFVPDAKVIAVLPPSNDQVVLCKFDADAALEKSGLDYLIVASQPPSEVRAGTKFTYPIKVKARDKKVRFQLDNGPKGMAVSAAGEVTWSVPADTLEEKHDVILTIRTESGQEVFHNFTLKVLK